MLIPGADGSAWYWHRAMPLLREAGHEAIAADLPGDDETAGLPEYTSLVTGAIGGRDDVVLVAQSLPHRVRLVKTQPTGAGHVPNRCGVKIAM